MYKIILDFFRNSICQLKWLFLTSFMKNFSTTCIHMLSKFFIKPPQKLFIFTAKAHIEKSLLFSAMLYSVQLAALPDVPYSYSTVQGPNTVTNYYDPNAGPSTGPGLSISPLQGRFSAPLNQSWNAMTPRPSSNIPNSYQPFADSVPTYQAIPTNYGAMIPSGSYQPLPTPYRQVPTNYYGAPVPNAYSSYETFPDTYTQFTDATVPQSTAAYSSVAAPPRPIIQPQATAYSPSQQPHYPRYQKSETLQPITHSTAPTAPGRPGSPTYLFPGLVRFYIDKWVGSEYLYDLQQAIGVVVEVVTPPGFSPVIDRNLIQQRIESIFESAVINPAAEAIGPLPPLPFFHVLIFATTEEDNYVFSISGRLFEQVKIARLDYNLPGTWQAITWEKQEFVLTSSSKFETQLLATAEGIAKFFVDRVRSFRLQKAEQEEQFKLQCEIKGNAGKVPPRK